MIDNKKKPKIVDPMELPSSNDDIEKFILKNRVKMYVHTINVIDSAIKNNEDSAELYKFSGSNYVVLLHDSNYKENLDFIFDELVRLEEYELCSYTKPIKEMTDKLEKKFMTNYVTK